METTEKIFRKKDLINILFGLPDDAIISADGKIVNKVEIVYDPDMCVAFLTGEERQ